MRLSAVVVMSVLSVGSITAQECDSIRIEGSKYFCNDMRLRKKADFQNALAANQEALAEYNAAAGLNIAANVIGGIGGFILGWGIGASVNESNPSHENAGTFMIIGGGIAVVGLGMTIGATSKVKKAVQLYNGKSAGNVSGLYLQVRPTAAQLTLVFQ